MTFGSVFGRTFSPTFQPSSQAAASSASTWWDLNGTITSCVAAYQPKGAASYAASLTDLTGNGYTLTEGATAPDWDSSTGWTGGDPLTTGITVSSGKTWSIIGLFKNAGDLQSIGKVSPYPRFGINRILTAGQYAFCNPSDSPRYTGTSTSMVACMAGVRTFLEGEYKGSAAGLESNITGQNIYCSTGYFWAVAWYNAVLSDEQVSDLTDAMNAL